MAPRFDATLLDRLRSELEVEVETRGASEAEHRAVIWVVVDDRDRVLIRSWRGAGARWYREAIAGEPVALHVDGQRVAVRVERATDADRIGACSAALESKYAGDPSTPSMVRDEILDTTLELHPG